MSINIYGAGIAGLSLAASLSANHFKNYKIFEKASDIRKSDTAIQLGFNCFQALKDLGVLELVTNQSILTNTLNIYSKNNLLKKTNIKGSLFIKRNNLIEILLSKIDSNKIVFNEKFDNKKIFKTDLNINATGGRDGVDSGRIASWGVINLAANHDKIFKELNLFMFPGMHLVTYPLTDNQLSFTYIRKSNNKKNNKIIKNILNPINDKKFEALINKTVRLHFKNKCNYLNDNKKVLKIGDAAHQFLPHLAQGGTQSLIDGVFISKYLIKNNFDEYIDDQKFSDFSRRRLQLLNKINFQSRINADVFQIENQFINSVRDFVIRFNTPSYNWLFNSYYEA
tara:strand:+ start:84 stop:1100 length:1017 start_codon:yes stop_codon:yes gene_type:complete